MKLSDAEWTVMNAVWAHAPASVRDVFEQVRGQTGWAYTTVKTVLVRLVEKGALAAHKRANASLFTPRLKREEARRSALRSMLANAFSGDFGPLVQHIAKEEKLSKRDRLRLAALLEENEMTREGGSDP